MKLKQKLLRLRKHVSFEVGDFRKEASIPANSLKEFVQKTALNDTVELSQGFMEEALEPKDLTQSLCLGLLKLFLQERKKQCLVVTTLSTPLSLRRASLRELGSPRMK
ncbi:hypothetical protein GB937_008805 [Aspergillus fischeri]|nr:hypothetical protein GB937_008805 [Aspergillus fischeri]